MIVKISFTVRKPKRISDMDFMEWIKYNCGEINEISQNNEMKDIEMENFIKTKNIKHRIIKK